MNTEMRRRFSTPLVRGLLVCLFGYSGFAAAAAISEAEPNDWTRPQIVQVPSEGLTISAKIGQVADVWDTDVDYFTFEAGEGDSVSIKIVGALKPDGTGACLGFPSNIALYDSAGGSPLAAGLADCEAQAEPSFKTTVSGPGRRMYIVGVSAWSHIFLDSGEVDSADMPTPGGTYQLVISGITPVQPPPTPDPTPTPTPDPTPTPTPDPTPTPTPDPTPTPTPTPTPDPTQSGPAKDVPIAVRHWHQDERDLGRRNGRDPITVAILSVVGFNAMTVDPNSLTFGATGKEKSLFRCRKDGKDINRDGRMDMVCYFKPDVANFQTGDMNGKLEGKTKSGQQIKGAAALRIFSVPKERRGFKHRGQRNGNDKGKR